MRDKFNEELDNLNSMLITMGDHCEEAISYAVKALNENSDEMRTLTFETDKIIDDMEREIEGICYNLLLRQQPVAKDLRLVSAALKMISDMERIGDQAYDIAEITKTIKDGSRSICSDIIDRMSATSIDMVTKSVDSFVKKDTAIAEKVIGMDDIVDDLFIEVKDALINAVAENKDQGEYFVDIPMIAKYLERISDHAVNIAEWVIFSITGKHVSEPEAGSADESETVEK